MDKLRFARLTIDGSMYDRISTMKLRDALAFEAMFAPEPETLRPPPFPPEATTAKGGLRVLSEVM